MTDQQAGPKPSATVTVRWCSECGRTDKRHTLRDGPHVTADGPDLCPGTVQTLTYVLQSEPQIDWPALILKADAASDPERAFATLANMASCRDPEQRPENGKQR